MIWIVPVLLIVLVLGLAWVAGRSLQPMTDRERFFFNGDPTACIACGRPLKRTRFVSMPARDEVVTVRCPNYTPGSEHEFYRWVNHA